MKQGPHFHELILQAAETLGSDVAPAPPEWTGPAFNAEVLSSASRRPAFQRNEKDLPRQVVAFRVDGAPLLIGEIHGPPNLAVVADQLRRYRNQATIARSWLGAEGPNLQLFLVGPLGALSHRSWWQLAAGVEADDRICRKLMWLFDGSPTLESAVEFLGRTFVATPWDKEEQIKAQLDQMADVGLPSGWQALVDDEELDAEGIVNRIIDLEGDAE
ncbi:hypothetical protein [Kaistia terrae]|uniref:Uncharacterized protein n=1 Tax=Kaistia terrae TaxID=537017 RepID=A0ABW0PYW8_9HYPH|nr:hypothetical protein [Kaistia terrae]MCX5581642.1 hypothetical protein [Kaistia terrae]